MWVLLHIKTGRSFYLLTDSKKYTVGRSPQCDLSINDDTSVSREHAIIHRSSSGVRVEDLDSKYGVYANKDIDTNKPIAKKTLVELKAGNIVRFGRLDSIFRLENKEINICTSTMSPESLETLKTQMKIIDGTVQSVWNTECTHLVMPSVTVTVKVLQSLAYGVPIVSPNYWEAYIDACRQHNPQLPNVNDFVPEITEPYIIKEPGMMAVHLDRQRLFQKKTFVFMVKHHMDRFEPIIKLAAGKCLNISDGKVRKSFLLKMECIPVQYTPSANTQCSTDIENIVSFIQSHDRRLISESEIGLALLHRSTDRFCNPDRKMVTDFEPVSVDPKSKILQNVLIEETPQTRNTEMSVPSSIVIPESDDLTGAETNNNLNKSSSPLSRKSARHSTKQNVSTDFQTAETSNAYKRKHNAENEQSNDIENVPEEPEQCIPSKKQKTDNENQGENSSAHFIEPLPPASQNPLNFSGFISTQNRRNRVQAQAPVESVVHDRTAKSSRDCRKRAVNMLDCDSDDETNDNDTNLFNFNRKSKRTKTSALDRATQRRGILSDNDDNDDQNDDDDDDGCLFNFSKNRKSTRQTQNNQRNTNNEANDVSEVDGPLIDEAQNAYTKPYQRSMNHSLNRTVVPIEILPMPRCETEWISTKIKRELNLNDETDTVASSSNSVKIKEEKLEEWEMTEEDKKRKWIDSLSNVFQVRNINVNMSRRTVADETDSHLFGTENTTLNRTKNFKKFIKKNNYIPRTTIIKTTPVPVVISAFDGI